MEDDPDAIALRPVRYWIVLLTHPFADTTTPAPGVENHFLFISDRPAEMIAVYNRQQPVHRPTQDAAPYWYPRLLTGPFYSLYTASVAVYDIKPGAIDIDGKVQDLIRIAQHYAVNVYDPMLHPSGGMAKYLSEHAGPAYVDAYHEYLTKTKVLDAVDTADRAKSGGGIAVFRSGSLVRV